MYGLHRGRKSARTKWRLRHRPHDAARAAGVQRLSGEQRKAVEDAVRHACAARFPIMGDKDRSLPCTSYMVSVFFLKTPGYGAYLLLWILLMLIILVLLVILCVLLL